MESFDCAEMFLKERITQYSCDVTDSRPISFFGVQRLGVVDRGGKLSFHRVLFQDVVAFFTLN
jgi:hypothetical protein